MAKEIERKFLVLGDEWKQQGTPVFYRQGYLSVDRERTVRVRTAGEKAFLTIKGKSEGISRNEFEYPIPLEDARFLLDNMCLGSIIEKYRRKISFGNMEWEVDEFVGDNAGLVLAEIELEDEDQPIELPQWIDREVSGNPLYYNASLSQNPFVNRDEHP